MMLDIEILDVFPWPYITLLTRLGVDSYTCKIAGLLEEASDDSPDVRSFLEQYRSFRIE